MYINVCLETPVCDPTTKEPTLFKTGELLGWGDGRWGWFVCRGVGVLLGHGIKTLYKPGVVMGVVCMWSCVGIYLWLCVYA